jgi:hypothetical protein
MRSSVVAAVIVILVVACLAAGYLAGSGARTTETITSVTTASTTSSSCAYVLPQAVPCLIGQNFTVSVNYTGHWEVRYQGYNCLGETCGIRTTNGSYIGTGSMLASIMVQGAAGQWTLCAQAQKLDASNTTLTLAIGGARNSTVLAYGSVSACDEQQLV